MSNDNLFRILNNLRKLLGGNLCLLLWPFPAFLVTGARRDAFVVDDQKKTTKVDIASGFCPQCLLWRFWISG
jgi:hypothetical protein